MIATFAPAKRLTLTKAGGGGGTVTSTPVGLDCGPTCSIPFPIGAIITLTATPDANSTFAGWSGKDAAACPGTGPCQVTMSAQRAITATFDPIAHQLATALAGDGAGAVTSDPVAIACPGTCARALQQGTMVTLTAVAEAGSVFTGLDGRLRRHRALQHRPRRRSRRDGHLHRPPSALGRPLGYRGRHVDADVGGIACPAMLRGGPALGHRRAPHGRARRGLRVRRVGQGTARMRGPRRPAR